MQCNIRLESVTSPLRLIILDCTDVGLPGCIVPVTYGEVQEVLQHSRVHLAKLFPYIVHSLHASPVKKLIYDEKRRDTFQTDVLIYHVAKYKITGKAIPILPSYILAHIGSKRCIYCGKQSDKECGKCRSRYCSRECQVADRRAHKPECLSYDKLSAEAKANLCKLQEMDI